jgi:hypothetical protein
MVRVIGALGGDSAFICVVVVELGDEHGRARDHSLLVCRLLLRRVQVLSNEQLRVGSDRLRLPLKPLRSSACMT